ncbi:unnamed protein product [Rangifer tarandus platyrhynchus]|uniref:Uncharacterized protein n=1 Tax=Rangifer tarandus platyrhynchus TaxID=3082113 RepID=A0ABN8Y895_RANTA|nr:unnamed protein product [Rangifer tarandus platyrhynchus]
MLGLSAFASRNVRQRPLGAQRAHPWCQPESTGNPSTGLCVSVHSRLKAELRERAAACTRVDRMGPTRTTERHSGQRNGVPMC